MTSAPTFKNSGSRSCPWPETLRLVSQKDPASVLSDEELVTELGASDTRHAAELYDRIYDPIDRALCRVLGFRDADHEDLMQRSFELVFNTITNQRFASACSLRTWGSAIATRVGLAALRARRRERRVVIHDGELASDAAELVPARDAERDVLSRLELDRVRRILGEMNPDQAETLVLHDVIGHHLSEVATLMGTSVAAAQSRLVRGRKRFRELSGGRR